MNKSVLKALLDTLVTLGEDIVYLQLDGHMNKILKKDNTISEIKKEILKEWKE